jgi:hypothetical protein
MNLSLHLSTEGSISLKIQSFLVVQMLHAMRMIISMKKGMLRCLRIRLIMEGTGLVVGITMPIEA